MRKFFIKYISIVTLCAMLVIMVFNYFIETRSRYNTAKIVAEYKLEQLEQTLEKNREDIKELEKSLAEDYITRAHAFAYIIKENKFLLNNLFEMNKVKDLLNVDELHVINQDGILAYGTVPRYYGMDFSETEQTSEFLPILEDPDLEIVQNIRPNGIEQKLFQYIGVSRIEEPGIVQIGMSPKRFADATQKNELAYIISNIPMDEGNFIMAIDKKGQSIIAHTKKGVIGKKSYEVGLSGDYLGNIKDVNFHQYENHNLIYTLKQYRDTYLCIGQTKDYIYSKRVRQLLLVCIYLFAVFLVIVVLLDSIIKKQIINGINHLIRDMKGITNGNLDTIVDVKGIPEFQLLSGEINQMVQSILGTTVKMSKIINMVDIPIGAFEINEDMSRVLVTERVGELLNLSKEDERHLINNKEQFQRYINILLEQTQIEEGVCKISDDPESYIKIREVNQEPGIFGIIQGVTDEILEKKQMILHSDYDALTGLCNRRRFEREVSMILQKKDQSCAAMLMFDLDKFKDVNDGFGHEFGDIYLKHIAKIFKLMNSDKCIAGRRSGDEFYVFFYDCLNKEEIYEQIRVFYMKLKDNPIPFPNGIEKVIPISVGIAFYTGGNESYDELLNEADQALYRAKEQGRGGYAVYLDKEKD